MINTISLYKSLYLCKISKQLILQTGFVYFIIIIYNIAIVSDVYFFANRGNSYDSDDSEVYYNSYDPNDAIRE